MKIVYLTGMGFYINGALGSGKYDNITIDDVKKEIRKKNILNYLEEKLGSDLDISLWNDEYREEIQSEWYDCEEAIDEKRKLAVQDKGLSLIMAYLLQSIQLRLKD